MPEMSGPNLQEKDIIETCKEEGCAVSTQETAARKNGKIEHLTRLSAPWNDGRLHPRVINQLAEGNKYHASL
jgi:hypothetical protein